MVVWGASLGWLVFYSALTYGVCSRGVELLCDLCDVSEQIQRAFSVEGMFVCYVCVCMCVYVCERGCVGVLLLDLCNVTRQIQRDLSV